MAIQKIFHIIVILIGFLLFNHFYGYYNDISWSMELQDELKKSGAVHTNVEFDEALLNKDLITFIGHSTVLIRLDGFNIITDPNFSNCVLWIFCRKSLPGISLEKLPPINLILISHGHYDHFDLPTLRQLPKNITIIAPNGLERYLIKLGYSNIRVISPWEKTSVHGIDVIAVPIQHFAGRLPFNFSSHAQGYILRGQHTIFFAGDTGLTPLFKEVGEKEEIDVALLPIGGYCPWYMKRYHMDPLDAVNAFKFLRAKKMVPIHYETFRISLEPFEEPKMKILDLKNQYQLDGIIHLEIGETLIIETATSHSER